MKTPIVTNNVWLSEMLLVCKQNDASFIGQSDESRAKLSHTHLVNKWSFSILINTNAIGCPCQSDQYVRISYYCLEAWLINSTHAPLNRDDGGLLSDAYLHLINRWCHHPKSSIKGNPLQRWWRQWRRSIIVRCLLASH